MWSICREHEKTGKSGNKMECAGYVLSDASGNVRKKRCIKHRVWTLMEMAGRKKRKEGDGSEETRCRNRKTIDVMSV